MNKLSIITIILFLLVRFGWAQDTYHLTKESKVVVKGTSTIHDWEVHAEEMRSSATFEMDNNAVERITMMELSIPVESLSSGKRGMDKNMYEALKSEKFPNILFEFKGVKSASANELRVVGDLTIAGNTREVELTGNYNVQNGKIAIKGSTTFPMTRFKVDPPTAMLGTIKTGDEVTIEYHLTYN
ncbi:MAG: YceI family protein [Candidatus Cyclobacteriaceae bacterium M3_2C_046]